MGKSKITPVYADEGLNERGLRHKILEIGNKNNCYKKMININKLLIHKLKKQLVILQLSKIRNIKKKRMFLKRLGEKTRYKEVVKEVTI